MSQSESGSILEKSLSADTVEYNVGLLYGLSDKPPVSEATIVAIQHVLASFVGIITPPIIICGALGVDPVNTSIIISMSLFASGISTFIQCRRFGPVGSGLLSLQGTSFAFLGPIIAIGTGAIDGGASVEQALALIFGCCLFGSAVEMILSRFLHLAQQIITPVVSGTVVMIIGLSLIKAGFFSLAGGAIAQQSETFGSTPNLLLGLFVLATVVLLTLSNNRFLRMGAIAIGLVIGYIIAAFLGMVNLSALSELPFIRFPLPLRYGLDFSPKKSPEQ
jgi:xanthine permease XanP